MHFISQITYLRKSFDIFRFLFFFHVQVFRKLLLYCSFYSQWFHGCQTLSSSWCQMLFPQATLAPATLWTENKVKVSRVFSHRTTCVTCNAWQTLYFPSCGKCNCVINPVFWAIWLTLCCLQYLYRRNLIYSADANKSHTLKFKWF